MTRRHAPSGSKRPRRRWPSWPPRWPHPGAGSGAASPWRKPPPRRSSRPAPPAGSASTSPTRWSPNTGKNAAARPGPGTRYRRTGRHRFTLSSSVDTAAVACDAAADGCFPLITNDTQMTDAELLAACKRQPRLERRYATFKGVLGAAPAELKSDYRIDALSFCLYAALLVHALTERELRNAMARAGLAELPLYHEDRACKTPTAARILELLSPLARTTILHRDQTRCSKSCHPRSAPSRRRSSHSSACRSAPTGAVRHPREIRAEDSARRAERRFSLVLDQQLTGGPFSSRAAGSQLDARGRAEY
jgi:hypothetical protein